MSEIELQRSKIMEVSPGKGRKKKTMPVNWVKNKLKHQRYAAKCLPKKLNCQHANKTFECESVKMQDVRRMHEIFYKEPIKQKQNDIILKYVGVCTPSRRRSRKDCLKREVRVDYFIPVREKGATSTKRVCREFFMNVLCIKKDRLQLLCRRFLTLGDNYPETRGGDKKSKLYEDKKKSVKNFIESIQSIESHYNRSKNITRQYLSSDLSISELHNMYQNKHSEELQVTYEYFRNIFVTFYNISFGTPSTDKCSTCLCMSEKLKNCETPDEKEQIKLKLTLHKTRADCFYKLLQDTDVHIKKITFDCQKNLILPKLPDQSAYYTRQMYLYNFTICEGNSKSYQNIHNTFAYLWLEHEFAKVSNQIASAVYHRLTSTDLNDVHTVWLFADGCGGQNKNSIMVSMVCFWLKNVAPQHIKEVQIIFPTTGHSFMPPDRVFGLIEREIRKKVSIVTPQEYISIISKHATAIRLGNECKVYNFKAETDAIIKKPGSWHFKFNPCKKFIIKLSTNSNTPLVRGEPYYRNDIGVAKGICKVGKSFATMNPDEIIKGNPLKAAKLNDIKFLLQKHFGDQWMDDGQLTFYKEIFESHASERITANENTNGDDIHEFYDDEFEDNFV